MLLSSFYASCKTTPILHLVNSISNCYDALLEEILRQDETNPMLYSDENSLLLACFMRCIYNKPHKKRFEQIRSKLPHNPLLVTKYLCECLSTSQMINRLDNLPTLLLFWPIDHLHARDGMTLLNMAVAERNEEAFYALLDHGASADVEDSVYNNSATLAMVQLHTPSPIIKRMTKRLLSARQLKEYGAFLRVCDALLTNNLLHIFSTLKQEKKFNANLRTCSNTSLLGFVNHVEILIWLLELGFVVTTKDIVRAVKYIDANVSLYIVRYCDVDGYAVASQCHDPLLAYKLLEARKEKEHELVKTLDTSTTIAKDVCKIISGMV